MRETTYDYKGTGTVYYIDGPVCKLTPENPPIDSRIDDRTLKMYIWIGDDNEKLCDAPIISIESGNIYFNSNNVKHVFDDGESGQLTEGKVYNYRVLPSRNRCTLLCCNCQGIYYNHKYEVGTPCF